MSFASWPSINHASAAPPFDPRPTDRGACDRDRRRRSPPRPSPSPPTSLSFVARRKRKPSSYPPRPTARPLVQIGNEAQGLARPPLTSLHFGCFCEPLYLGERGGRLHQPAPVLPYVCCICWPSFVRTLCRISNLTRYLPLNPLPVSPPLPSSLVPLVLHPPSRSAATQRGIKEERRWISSACFARSPARPRDDLQEGTFSPSRSLSRCLVSSVRPSVRPPSSIAKRSEAWPGGRQRRGGEGRGGEGRRDRTSLCGLSLSLSPWTTNQGGTSERRMTARHVAVEWVGQT